MKRRKTKTFSPLIKVSTFSIALSLLTACGSGDNSSPQTIGDNVLSSEKDHYFIPNEFYDYVQYDSETLQYQVEDSYLEYSYSDQYSGVINRTTILADGLPGDTLYTRVLITGLADEAVADVIVESDDNFAQYAIDKASGNYGETTYQNDISKLSFQSDASTLKNGSWVWLKIPVSEFEQVRSVQLTVGNSTNPETGATLDEGYKTATVTVKSPSESFSALPFEFNDRLGLDALPAGESVVELIELTRLEIFNTPISDLETQKSHVITGLTTSESPITLSSEEGVAQYRIKRRGAEVFEPWTSKPGIVEPFDRVEVKITASQTKLATVSATLTIGEGDNSVSDDWVIETLGDIDMSRGVLFPPKSSFTNSKTLDARGRILLREQADETTELISLILRKVVNTEPESMEKVVDLLPQYNPINGLWGVSLELAEEASTRYVVEATTSLNETITSEFNVTQSSIVPSDFPSAENAAETKLTHGHDVTVDVANNRYIVNNTKFNSAKLISVDMNTSERKVLADTNAVFGGKSNSYGVQVDATNNRVFVSNNPTSVLHQFNLSDFAINSIFSSDKAPAVGKGPQIKEPTEIDIDYINSRVVMGNNNGAGNGLYIYEMTTGDRCRYTSGRIQSVAVDHDMNRYLFLKGSPENLLMSAPIAENVNYGSTSCNNDEEQQLGLDSYPSGRSVAVVSYQQLEAPIAIEQWTAQGFIKDGQPVDVAEQVGFALVGDKADEALYKVDLKNGTRELFSSNGVPNFDVPFKRPESVVVEYGLGFALVSDVDNQALYGVDLKTGQRVIITK